MYSHNNIKVCRIILNLAIQFADEIIDTSASAA